MNARLLALAAALALVTACGHRETSTTNTSTTKSTTTVATTAPAAAPAAATVAPAGAMNATGASTHANQPPEFDTESAAQTHCATDEVVWVNNKSKIYHAKGARYYGQTKNGAYACRHEADAAGDRASKAS